MAKGGGIFALYPKNAIITFKSLSFENIITNKSGGILLVDC